MAGVTGYVGLGSTCVTCPSVFLAVNWSDFSALFSQVSEHAGPWAPESGQMVAPGPAVRFSESISEPCHFQHPCGLGGKPLTPSVRKATGMGGSHGIPGLASSCNAYAWIPGSVVSRSL